MKKVIVIILAILIAASGGLLVYGAILGPAKTFVPEKDGVLFAPPANIYSEGKTAYDPASALVRNASSDQIAEALVNVCYNHLRVKRYYFFCHVDSLSGNKYGCSDYFRIVQDGTDFFYQALTYASGTNTGVRHASMGNTRFDVTTFNVTYDRASKTFDAAFPDPTPKETPGTPYNYYPDRPEVLFNLPLALADESGQAIDYSVMANCSFELTLPSSSAQYYTLELTLSPDSVNASSETIRCLNDCMGGKMKNINVSALSFRFEIWKSGVFRKIDVNSEFTSTVSGKSGSGMMTRAYEFSYTPEAGSILKQLKDADWEKFCPQKDKDILSARENSWIE